MRCQKGKNVWMNDRQRRNPYQDELKFSMNCLVSVGSRRNFLALRSSNPDSLNWTLTHDETQDPICNHFFRQKTDLSGSGRKRSWEWLVFGAEGKASFFLNCKSFIMMPAQLWLVYFCIKQYLPFTEDIIEIAILFSMCPLLGDWFFTRCVIDILVIDKKTKAQR